jgi:hypothetical protein
MEALEDIVDGEEMIYGEVVDVIVVFEDDIESDLDPDWVNHSKNSNNFQNYFVIALFDQSSIIFFFILPVKKYAGSYLLIFKQRIKLWSGRKSAGIH